MTDIRAKPFQAMTDGTYVVPVELSFTIDGEHLTITDHSDQGIGDACAALHHAAAETIGGQILDVWNTDRFQRKPADPDAVQHENKSTQGNSNG
ncbi:MAG: hypothetical protein IPG45_28365 [Deltaproteobacteria bacterium]|nr:hypothetical protein [Deltaproteobacteria bacterium]